MNVLVLQITKENLEKSMIETRASSTPEERILMTEEEDLIQEENLNILDQDMSKIFTNIKFPQDQSTLKHMESQNCRPN